MKILAVSDVESNLLYGPMLSLRFRDVDMVIGCGDLSYFYLEYILSVLNVPCYYVRGNHARQVEYGSGGQRDHPWGAVDLHRKCRRDPSGLLLAGVEGSLRYSHKPYQYSQLDMWFHVFRLVPQMLINRMRYGRFLDVFVTHASPWMIHDCDDLPHQGIKAFRWLVKVFQPALHLHGHIHIYHPDTVTETRLGNSLVVNAFRYREMSLDMQGIPSLKKMNFRQPEPCW